MSISTISNTSTASAPTGKDPITGLAMKTNAGKQALGADDFMKLLTTQLTAQDPMNPMKDTEFISQMANFTSLEQMRTLSKSFETFTSDQKLSAAPAFLGRNVTVKDASGDVTGLVDAITLKDGKPALVINGKTYDTSLITGIATPPPPPNPSVANPNTTPTQS
ncbi:MAG: flagellar hook capping FlgD N-terminal domain-containing protein [bacterium]